MSEEVYKNTLLDQAGNVFYGLTQSLDDYLLEFFGTKENAERYSHLYILEQHPYQFETELDAKTNMMRVTAHTTYRLRFKTQDEMRVDPNDKP